MVWESIKEFLDPRTITSPGKVSGLLLIVALAVAARYSDNHRKSRKYFVCNTNQPNKSFIEAECFDKYGQEYGDTFPPDAFVGFWLFLVAALLVYTVFASRHVLVVEHYKNDLYQMPQNRRRKMEGSCSVFVLYIIQLVLRVATLVVFTCLQLTLRRMSFPATYKCPLKSPVDCKDNFYKENKILDWVAVGLSATVFTASLTELLLLITKCCLNRRRYRNLQFICFLLDVDETKLQEGYDYTELTLKLKRKFLAMSENLEEIYGEKLKTDTIFTKLLLQKGQHEHSLDFEERTENLLSYTGDASTNVIEQAYQLFMPGEDTANPKLIFITGRAGIGKTMFSTKLVRDWASDTLFPHKEINNKYKFVFLFYFRQLNEIKKDLSLFDFLSLSHELDANEFEFVCKNPEQILIVMDGLDEFKNKAHVDSNSLVPPQDKQSIATICSQLLNRSVLNGATVVVTSRHGSMQLIKFDRKAEILGFKPKDVEDYFKRFFGGEVENANLVLGHVKENANIAGLCYVPVNCFIICTYFKWYLENCDSSTEKYKFPSTITGLYQDILKMFTLKHHKFYKGQKYSDTPDVTPVLAELSKLSFELLQARKYVFNQEDLRKVTGENGASEKVTESGIIHSIPGCRTGTTNVETKYCFIHLTFQEFLAALFLVKKKNAYAFIQNAIEQNLDVVIQFVSGILRTASPSDKARELLSFIIEKLILKNRFLLAINCMFEFGSSSFAKQVVQQYDFTNLRLRVNDSDCAALAFLLSLDVETNHKTKVLDLSHSSITCVGLRSVMDALESPNCCIESLDLSHCKIDAKGAKYVSEALSSGHCTLQSLDVSYNNIGAEGAKYVSENLSSGHCTLQSLNVSINDIGAEGAKYVSEALSSGHCTLQSLDVSDNNIGAKGAKYISEALSSGHCTLQSLVVYLNNIGAKGAKYISEALSSGHCTLQSLVAYSNNIDAEGAKYISEALSSGHCTLQSLYVGDNNIGDEGAKYVSEALSCGHCKLHSLNVCNNNIGAEGAKYLSEALSSGHCTLQSLYVGDNNIGDEGVKYVYEALSSGHCTTNLCD